MTAGLYTAEGRALKTHAGIWQWITYDSGSGARLEAGDTLLGDLSGAIATVVAVRTRSGSWAGNDAAGYLLLEGVVGTYLSEPCNTSQLRVFGPSMTNRLDTDHYHGQAGLLLDPHNTEFGVIDGVLGGRQQLAAPLAVTVYYREASPAPGQSAVLDLFVGNHDSPAKYFDFHGLESSETVVMTGNTTDTQSVTFTVPETVAPKAGDQFRMLLVRDGDTATDNALTELVVTGIRIDGPALPAMLLAGPANGFTLNTTPHKLDGYAVSAEWNWPDDLDVDPTAGEITIPADGIYSLQVHVHLVDPSNTNNAEILLYIDVSAGPSVGRHLIVAYAVASHQTDNRSFSVGLTRPYTEGDVCSLWFEGSQSFGAVTIPTSSFELHKVAQLGEWVTA